MVSDHLNYKEVLLMTNINTNSNKANSKNMGDDNMVANTNIYKITEELEKQGWMYDDTGVYVPYTHKNEEYYDPRNVYLKISRSLTEEQKIIYCFGKLEEELFYPMEYCSSAELICDKDTKLARNISYAGKRCNLNSGPGSYKNFISDIKDNINVFDGLDILKNSDYNCSKMTVLNSFTANAKTHKSHNFMDMRELVKLATGQEPKYTYPKKGYDMFLCPFHNDHNASARVFKHTFQCFKHTQRQFDQTEFLKWLFYLKTVPEVEIKFQELLQ